jgi:hypothetical protein
MIEEGSTAYCEDCRTELTAAEEACPQCSSTRRSVTVRVRGVDMAIAVDNVGTVTDGTDLDGTGRRVAVTSPAGSRSEAISRDGEVRLDVSARGDVGRPGEPRVRDILVEALRNGGSNVDAAPGDDVRGEDGVLHVDGRRLAMQAVTVPVAKGFWQGASTGSATTRVPNERAAHWVHEALEKKASALAPDARRQTLLAIDANHAAPLSTSEVVEVYHSVHPPACKEFGFAAVWIVGPTASLTTCLDRVDLTTRGG